MSVWPKTSPQACWLRYLKSFDAMRFCWLVLLMLPLFINCGKIGEPQPPAVIIPPRSQSLSGRQVGDRIILESPIPKLNTNGTRPSRWKRIDIYRLAEPKEPAPRPLTEEEYAERAERIKSIQVEESTDYTKNEHLVFHDRLDFTQPSVFKTSFRYAVKFINDKNKDGGFSNFVYLSPAPSPEPPDDLQIGYDQRAIEIRWKPAKSMDDPDGVVGYNVFRRAEEEAEERQRNEQPVTENVYRDPDFQFGKTYYYSVSAVVKADHPTESFKSRPSAITPIDTFPPSPPSQLTAFAENGRIHLVWTPSPEPDVAGYNVYRSERPGKQDTRLNPTLLIPTAYKDETVQVGKRYFYVVTAVDKNGNESGYSNEVAESP